MKLSILSLLLITTSSALALQSSITKAVEPDCSKPPAACNKPVKWIANKGDCSCFACEYGTPAQHIVCTSDKDAKARFLKLEQSEDEHLASWPVKNLNGTISWTGDTATLKDENGKNWSILNPEALKGHPSHVQVKAHVEKEKSSIEVMRVLTWKSSVQNASNKEKMDKKEPK